MVSTDSLVLPILRDSSLSPEKKAKLAGLLFSDSNPPAPPRAEMPAVL